MIVSSKISYSLACYVKAFVGIRGDRPMPVLKVSFDHKLNVCYSCGIVIFHLISAMDKVTKLYRDPVSNIKSNINLRFFIHRISLV